MSQGRIVHITLPKCGSQWVRDVLAAPDLAAHGAAPYSGITMDVQHRAIPHLPPNTFSGPIYGMDRWEWLDWKDPNDKAVVVLRDPRDRLVSEVYSVAYSHESNPSIDMRRQHLLGMPSARDWISCGIDRSQVYTRFYRSWTSCRDDSVFLLHYEELLSDEHAAFRRLVTWLGWTVPDEVLASVVDRLSFKTCSGREPGTTDVFSHYRRGVAGDWKNHFDRRHGELWEYQFPGLLKLIGYEANSRWWEELPEPADQDTGASSQPDADETTVLRKRNEILEHHYKEKEAVIQRQATIIQSLQEQVHRASVDTATQEERLESQLTTIQKRNQELLARLRTLAAQGRDAEHRQESLKHELAAKEDVIRKQAAVIRRHQIFTERTPGVKTYQFIRRHAAAALRPRLGRLAHHPPREIRRLPSPAVIDCRSTSPRISVVTPSLNQGEYIERTLRSALEQNYPNLEYCVQDGASTDRTAEVLERWQSWIADWRSEPDQGQSDALNRAFARTSGEIMAWLNADDLLLPGSLECVARYFSHHPEVDVVYGDRLLIDEHDREIGSWVLPKHDDAVLSWVDFVPQETLFWHRRIWERAGARIDDSFRFAMDWELLIRFRDAGARFAHINRFLGAFRIHAHQKTSASINEVGQPEMDRIREHCLGHVPEQAEIRRAVAPYLVRHVGKHLLYRLAGRC